MWFTELHKPILLTDLTSGQRLCLRREVARSPGLIAVPGRTGTLALVDQTEGEERIEVLMDAPFFDDPERQKTGSEAYGGNRLQWHRLADDDSPLTAFLADCELLDDVSGGAHA